MAKIDSVYGLTADPATITPDYTAATVGTDAGNLGLILGAIINENQYLCPPAAGTLVTSLAADIADGVFDGLSFGSPIGYCGGDLAPLAGITAMQDALSGLAQFGLITQGFAFGGKGNVLTQNGLANLAVNGTKAYPLTPLTTIETALAKAAPVPKNSFAPAAQTATMNVGRFLHRHAFAQRSGTAGRRNRSRLRRSSGQQRDLRSADQQLSSAGGYAHHERRAYVRDRNPAAQWVSADCGRSGDGFHPGGQHRTLSIRQQHFRRGGRHRDHERRTLTGGRGAVAQR